MQKVTKKIQVPIPEGVFTPKVQIGHTVTPETLLGELVVDKINKTLKIPDGAKVLVDDGILVGYDSPIFLLPKSMANKIIKAQTEGIVKVTDNAVRITEGTKTKEFTYPLWGRVTLVSGEHLTVQSDFFELPILISKGTHVTGKFYSLIDKGSMIIPNHIPEKVNRKIVLLGGPLTYKVFVKLRQLGAKGIIAPSILWQDYLEIFKHDEPNVGILQAFGGASMWHYYKELFANKHLTYGEADFGNSHLNVLTYGIMNELAFKEVLLFKDLMWGKKVRSLEKMHNKYMTVLDSSTRTLASEEELQKIL